jgi:hypothetical protein
MLFTTLNQNLAFRLNHYHFIYHKYAPATELDCYYIDPEMEKSEWRGSCRSTGLLRVHVHFSYTGRFYRVSKNELRKLNVLGFSKKGDKKLTQF